MPDPNAPESQPVPETNESFEDIFSQYERTHSRKAEGGKPREGTVVAVTADSVLVDIGFKSEGILPLAAFQSSGETVKPGDKLPVSVKGRNPEGYYELSRTRVEQPTDWASLERAFNDKVTIAGTVTAVVKGGLSVDVGVRAFMPASRSGARDAAEMSKLVGQEIRCRITKLDVDDEDVVVDRRIVAEEEESTGKQRRFSELKEGDIVSGTVRNLADYGAFVDIGGVDALLHVGEIAWSRVNNPGDVLSVGQQIEARVLKIDPQKRRISLGMKQLQPHPWDSAGEKFKVGERVRGTVTRLTDFGAFVELEPGIEGLIHVSEMSWVKKVRKPSDILKTGETVDAVILGVNAGERRLSLGLKQTLGDPWTDVVRKIAAGSVIEGPVTSLTKFGAFVQISEGVEGMIHVSEISAEKRIHHPQDVFKVGQQVKAQVLQVDAERRLIKLSIKQMLPSSLDEYLVEHKEGDVVSGRVIEVSGTHARVELGQGIQITCRIPEITAGNAAASAAQVTTSPKLDLSSLSSQLSARWKGAGPASGGPTSDAISAGQIRSFRITKLEVAAKQIEVELHRGN
jgi:small subunit ribosomal protein S1